MQKSIVFLGFLCLFGSIAEVLFENSLEEASAAWITYMQASENWMLDQFFLFLGTFTKIIFVWTAFIIYLCINKQVGAIGVLVFFNCAFIGAFLKICFAHPRPLYSFASVRAVKCSKDFGFPSGHAITSSGVVFSLSANWLNQKLTQKVIVISSSLIVVAIDRLYLGAHFHFQVLMGFLYSGFIVSLCEYQKVVKILKSFSVNKANLVNLHISAIGVLVIVFIVYWFRDGEIDERWKILFMEKCSEELSYDYAVFKHFDECSAIFSILGFCLGYSNTIRTPPNVGNYYNMLSAIGISAVFLGFYLLIKEISRNLLDDALYFVSHCTINYIFGIAMSYGIPFILNR